MVTMAGGTKYESGFVLNTTYASVNQVNAKVGFEPFNCSAFVHEKSAEVA